ncbi:MAG: hypothetical protein H8M99_02430 [Gloeobacteraceae cyanobacterium ES-bin-144]|nr:hypothetical protein [Verrucomicrobiales bacterium]
MKKTVFPRTVALLFTGMVASLSAQNLVSNPHATDAELKGGANLPRFEDSSVLPASYEVPAVAKASGELPAEEKVYSSQSSSNLGEKTETSRNVESVVDLNVLRNPSPYRKVMVSTQGQSYEVASDNLQNGLATISAVYREAGKTEKNSNCSSIALSVEQRVKLDPAKVLEVVESEVKANSGCACEIVKTAIKSSEADTEQVVLIVETAIHAAPETMRIVSQCAIAAMPDSIAAVQALLAKIDPNAGEAGSSAKSAKSGKDAKVATIITPPIPNPLDLPPSPPPVMPPPYNPPSVSDPNPPPLPDSCEKL